MPIQVLPEDVAAKIAAGEVIERPSSVVKELVENAIDAGAHDIRVEIREGGIRLIRVLDDGCGIPAAETETAFLRHATSKLRTASDLERIVTLGFRGEALASIAAVSQVTLLTRPATEEVGTRLRLEGGVIVNRSGQGSPVGALLTVENLFYNIPARRKFLRSEATEAAHIMTLVTRYALAWPHLRFSLLRDGRLVFQSVGNGQMMDVILRMYDLDTTRQLIEIQSADKDVSVWGYTALPALTRSDRNHLSFFVNRRWVQDRMLARALVEAYHGLLPSGRYPLAFLHVELDPAEVDVNVHPTKAEVRFRRSGNIFTAVQKAVRQALGEATPVRSLGTLPQAPTGSLDQPAMRPLWDQSHDSRWSHFALEMQRPADAPPFSMEGREIAGAGDFAGQVIRPEERPFTPERPIPRNLPPLRVLGQLGQTYIIAEGPAGLYLIDQHTAHERVLYERFRGEQARQSVAHQQLLTPLTVELAPLQTAALLDNLDTVSGLGFDLESFGDDTLLVRAIPAMLGANEVAQTLSDLADRLSHKTSNEDLFEEALITLVCHSAVRAGKTLSYEEMRDLIRQLEETSLPHTCPHGRPIFLHLSTDRLAHAFGRP